MRRYEGCHPLGQVSMGIDQRDAPASLDILTDKGLKEGSFAGAGLANDVEVKAAVRLTNTEPLPIVAKVESADLGDV